MIVLLTYRPPNVLTQFFHMKSSKDYLNLQSEWGEIAADYDNVVFMLICSPLTEISPCKARRVISLTHQHASFNSRPSFLHRQSIMNKCHWKTCCRKMHWNRMMKYAEYSNLPNQCFKTVFLLFNDMLSSAVKLWAVSMHIARIPVRTLSSVRKFAGAGN